MSARIISSVTDFNNLLVFSESLLVDIILLQQEPSVQSVWFFNCSNSLIVQIGNSSLDSKRKLNSFDQEVKNNKWLLFCIKLYNDATFIENVNKNTGFSSRLGTSYFIPMSQFVTECLVLRK